MAACQGVRQGRPSIGERFETLTTLFSGLLPVALMMLGLTHLYSGLSRWLPFGRFAPPATGSPDWVHGHERFLVPLLCGWRTTLALVLLSRLLSHSLIGESSATDWGVYLLEHGVHAGAGLWLRRWFTLDDLANDLRPALALAAVKIPAGVVPVLILGPLGLLPVPFLPALAVRPLVNLLLSVPCCSRWPSPSAWTSGAAATRRRCAPATRAFARPSRTPRSA